jgi:hypothetical protein
MTTHVRSAAAVLALAAVGAAVVGQEPPDTNYDESKVPPYVLPDPLVRFDGAPVADAAAWRAARRPEILRAFAVHVYGQTPQIAVALRFETMRVEPNAVGGRATRKEVRIRLFAEADAPWIDLLLYIPNNAPGPVPAFLGLNYGNQGVDPDPAIAPSREAQVRRGEHAPRWPLALLITRGYAVASFHGGDLELDRCGSGCSFTQEAWAKGLRGFLRANMGAREGAEDEWGAIGVWAWGLSRALDYLQTDLAVDRAKVAVIGHSRTGKTALWAGAQDERFALVISNESGQGGASLARRRFGETVAASYARAGSWYCPRYRMYGDNEAALPVDQHMLIALIAPRPVYVASAERDLWSDPRGEFLAALAAEPVYRLSGTPGLGVAAMPPVDRPVGETIGYHVRSGEHEITPYDWERYLDFADRHFGRARAAFTVRAEAVLRKLAPDFCWFHPRAAALPGFGKEGRPAVIMTLQKHLVVSDYYSGLYFMRTDDLGATWTGPTEIPELAWRKGPDGETIAVCDVTPGWHEKSGKLIAIGIKLRYAADGRELVDLPRSHECAYAVYDPRASAWSSWKILPLPDTEGKFFLAAPGCVQWLVRADGSLLVPMYFKGAAGSDYRASVLLCAFDGQEMTYLEHGDELAIEGGRGFCEPSLACAGGRYFLTLRNDARAYVTASTDGLHFGPVKPWTFDDGQDLGSYNTQAHWLAHGDALFLAYTRRGAGNDHIARNRAPIFLAEVDPEKLCVLRKTEQAVLPERGVMLGNFGAAAITPEEAWITDAEFIHGTKPHPRGADGTVWLGRVTWAGSRPR